jgi:agmatinase
VDFKPFTAPEKTKAGYGFADTPVKISFKESEVVFYGVPLDITASFGKGTARGPEAIRVASARQIETFVLDEKADIYDCVGIFDLGDLRVPKTKSKKRVLDFLEKTVPRAVDGLRADGKIPVMLGGEHTLTYYQLKALAKENPIVIHFDAHRDMKVEYDGMKMCHTTPFYHLLEHIPGENIIQIGIRQADNEENETAIRSGVTTFDAWQVHDDIDAVMTHLQKATAGKKIYISFDIDAFDLAYVPCTGTPEPFGLDPFQVVKILKAIPPSARLVGMDMVEVGLKNDDYREGALATQIIYRILARKYARP